MPKRERAPRKACCLVSEILEQSGVDRAQVKRLRRQVLEGVILLCQWQLERLRQEEPKPRASRARKVPVA